MPDLRHASRPTQADLFAAVTAGYCALTGRFTAAHRSQQNAGCDRPSERIKPWSTTRSHAANG
jgi:hypothetical protein